MSRNSDRKQYPTKSLVRRTSKKSGLSRELPFGDAVSLLASCKSAVEYPSRIHIAAALAGGETIETNGYKYTVVFA